MREILAARRRASRCTARRKAASAPTPSGSSTRSTAPRTSCTASTRSVCRSGSCRTAARSSASCTRRCCVGADGTLGRTYWATAGGGAFRDGRRDRASAAARPSRRSSRPASRSGASTCCPSTSRRSNRRCTRFEDLRRVGAASLDLCWVAEGVFDGFFELRLGPWDVAAGRARGARGRRHRHRLGRRPDAWLASGDILAAPPAVHTALLELTAAPRAPRRTDRMTPRASPAAERRVHLQSRSSSTRPCGPRA